MNYNDLIMGLLEEKGLDKRFRDNPEAVRKICKAIKVVKDSVRYNFGYTNISIDEEDFAKNVIDSPLVNREDNYLKYFIENDYNFRGSSDCNHWCSILEDGSFFMYDSIWDYEDGLDRDSKQLFSIGKKGEDLIVTESWRCLSGKKVWTGVRFKVFNRHGLEMQSKELRQLIVPDYFDNSYKNLEGAIHAASKKILGKTSPIFETIIERESDLATEHYCRQCEEGNLLSRKSWIIRGNKSPDAIRKSSLYDAEHLISGVQLSFSRTELIQYLRKPDDDDLTDEERDERIQKAYVRLITESKAFRETLLDSAKTNPKLQAIAAKFNLLKTTTEDETSSKRDGKMVRKADFKRAYDEISGNEPRTTTQTIIESSKEVRNEENEK